MNTDVHHIRLVAGIEIRPPALNARFMLEHAEALRLSEPVAEDLAACIPQATEAHLCLAGSLLEPGQILSPNQSPWDAMIEIGRLNQMTQPGVTAIGSHQGRPAKAQLGPLNPTPSGLFVCLPMLLSIEGSQSQALETVLEQILFDQGGLKPPSLGTLFDITGLEPVHGQLMTLTDLMALTKMQLAAAGMDAFWAPVEHALLQPEQRFDADMPAGIDLAWSAKEKIYTLEFKPFDQSGLTDQDYALWLRAFRQTTALLDTHWIDWSCRTQDASSQIEAEGRWLMQTIDTDQQASHDSDRAWIQQLGGPGLVAYSTMDDGQLRHFYPLKSAGIAALEQRFADQGKTLLRAAEWSSKNGQLQMPIS